MTTDPCEGPDRAAPRGAARSALVLGVGNPLMGDEGVGVVAVERLGSDYELPPEVSLLDAGTMGMGMLDVLRGPDYVVVIDALDGTERPPGSVVALTPGEVAPNQILHSLHDVRLPDVLAAAELVGIDTEVDFVGVQVGRMEQAVTTLTPDVEDAVPTAVERAVQLLAERGFVLKKRTAGS